MKKRKKLPKYQFEWNCVFIEFSKLIKTEEIVFLGKLFGSKIDAFD
jgi:hypothetical protein